MKALKLLTVLAFVLSLMFVVGCEKKEQKTETAPQKEAVVETADSLHQDMDSDSIPEANEAAESEGEATGH